MSAVVLAPGLAARGGAERLALQCAAALRDLGHETWLATEAVDLAAVGDYLATDTRGLRLLPLPPPRRGSGRVGRLLATSADRAAQVRAVRRISPDVFVAVKYKSELPGLGRRSLDYVLFPHHRERRARRLATAVLVAARGVRPWRDALATYDDVLAISAFTATHVRSRWGLDATVVPPPCGGPPRPGPAHRDRVIVGVGRLARPRPHVPSKRHDVLVDAFTASALPGQGWSLHLAGSSDADDPGYADELRDLGRGHPVHVHPDLGRGELDALLARASVYWHAQGVGEDPVTHPEAHEHFGITVVEAMAAGAIPLVHAGGGPEEIVAGVGRTWATVGELVARTEAVAALDSESEAAARQRVVARAAEFGDAAFRDRLSTVLAGTDR